MAMNDGALIALGLLVFALSGLILSTIALRHFARRWNSPGLRALYLIPLTGLVIAFLGALFLAGSAAWAAIGAKKDPPPRTEQLPAGALGQ